MGSSIKIFLPAKQIKLHVFSILLKWNGEYMELGLFGRQCTRSLIFGSRVTKMLDLIVYQYPGGSLVN